MLPLVASSTPCLRRFQFGRSQNMLNLSPCQICLMFRCRIYLPLSVLPPCTFCGLCLSINAIWQTLKYAQSPAVLQYATVARFKDVLAAASACQKCLSALSVDCIHVCFANNVSNMYNMLQPGMSVIIARVSFLAFSHYLANIVYRDMDG